MSHVQAGCEPNGLLIQRLCKGFLTTLADLVKQMEDAVDLDKPSFADPGCTICTLGTTPDHRNTGHCAYHRAVALLTQHQRSET